MDMGREGGGMGMEEKIAAMRLGVVVYRCEEKM